jgi:glycerate kinase
VIAPDSFKGTASAAAAAAAIGRGWSSIRPSDDLVLLPMADGGEGTLDTFAAAVVGARWMPARVIGPDNSPVETEWLLLPDGTGVVELARASGLTLLDPLLPLDAHTFGFGELIAAALDTGVSGLILAIGGSSSTDGGAGALAALGVEVLNAAGIQIPLGNRGLATVETVDWGNARRPPGSVVVLCDVSNPLLGKHGAAAVFGPQKGATPADITEMDANLARFARILGADPNVPGSGAAGGTSFGLVAWGAQLRSGAEEISARSGLDAAIAAADLVITGEGRFDSQSAGGKIPHHIATLADELGTATLLVAGLIEAPTAQFTAAASLTDLAGDPAAAQAEAVHWLEVAGADLGTRWQP